MQLINYKKCPLCNSGHFHSYKEIKDYSVSKEVFTLSKCSNCSLVFTNPIPDEENISRYYKSDTYISHTNKANNPLNFLYMIARSFTLKNKVNLIKKYGGKNILDIGCGTGLFLEEAYKSGFSIKGVETDGTARSNQSQLVNNEVVTSISDLSDKESFDNITLWHVLEHIHNVNYNFELLAAKLKKEGYIFIAVPNHESWDARHYKNYWAAWDVPRHLYHFTRQNVVQLFDQHNISLVKTIPMKLDAYYVSMLSEKYKGQSTIYQLLNGFINGIKSNFKAVNKNYSSIIYIGQKNEQ